MNGPTDLTNVDEEPMAESMVALPEAVSVVIPAYNEGPHIAEQVQAVEEALRRSGWTHEILVVDDGSTDGTADEVRKTSARLLKNPSNLGYGATLKRGIAAARHDWILITDADGTYPADAIPALLSASADQDMVVGARIGERVNVPLERRPAKWVLRKLSGYLAGQKIPDLNSGLRLMRRDFVRRYEHLLPDGFSFTTTITLSGTCNHHAVKFLPIDYAVRLGHSKIRPRHALDFLVLIIRTTMLFNPLKVFLPMGLGLLVCGLGKLAYDVVIGNLSESALLLLLGALIVWSVGLLADQNARLGLRR